MHAAEHAIVNKRGLHARAASKFVNLASTFESDVLVRHDGEEADGKSILSLMVLGAAQGSRITIAATGPDEQDAVRRLGELVDGGFGEDD